MQGYQEIQSQEQMNSLLDSFHGFHDSMTKEVRLANRGFVEADHRMFTSGRLDVQLLIQSSFNRMQ